MTVGVYRTKPFNIQAIQWFDDEESFADIQKFTGKTKFRQAEKDDITAEVYDELHDTWVGVKTDQWIIKGNKGEFYPCDPEIFDAKYEFVRPADSNVISSASLRG